MPRPRTSVITGTHQNRFRKTKNLRMCSGDADSPSGSMGSMTGYSTPLSNAPEVLFGSQSFITFGGGDFLLESDRSLGDNHKVPRFQRHVPRRLTFFQNLSDVDHERLGVAFARPRLACDLHVLLIGKIVEAAGAHDRLAQRKNFVTGDFLR